MVRAWSGLVLLVLCACSSQMGSEYTAADAADAANEAAEVAANQAADEAAYAVAAEAADAAALAADAAAETAAAAVGAEYIIGETFAGYDCTKDCSGHEAGYEWAEDNDVTAPEDCGGNSQSFIEGCEAWAEENS